MNWMVSPMSGNPRLPGGTGAVGGVFRRLLIVKTFHDSQERVRNGSI